MPFWRKKTTVDEPQPNEVLLPTPANTLGLHTVYEPGDEPELDIVAVHGLGGDSFKTWSHTNGTFWLRDLLPKAIDQARIMTFGYDANVFTKAPTQRSFLFAEDLVTSLQDERTGLARKRPLFIIAHSLGGIVIKKALLYARIRPTLYKDLVSSVQHLVFFGTPHQGANSTAGFLNDLGTALTRAKDGSVLRELALWSPSLLELNSMFVDIAGSFTITTFFEMENTYGTRIVNEGSARLNTPKESVIGLNANHFGICKFENADDAKYRAVLRRLKAEVSQLREVTAEREHEQRVKTLFENDMLDKLPTAEQAPFNIYQKRDDPLCLEDTRIDVRKQIRAWVHGNEDSCIFWLNGMAGAGKSTIARSIGREFQETGQLAASFFFIRDRGDVAHARLFYTTIAKQLAGIGNTILRREICRAVSEQPNILKDEPEDQWQKLIYRPLSKLKPRSNVSPLIIIIDALDECNSKKDVGWIIELFARMKNLPSAKLRIIVTSRPDHSIQSFFRQPDVTHRAFTLHDVPKEIVDADICLYFYAKLTDLSRIFPWIPLVQEWPGIDGINLLVTKAAGLFIYAATVCRFLEDEESEVSPQERLETLLSSSHTSGDLADPGIFDVSPTKAIDNMYAQITRYAFGYVGTRELKKARVTLFQQLIGPIIILMEFLPVQSLAELLNIREDTFLYHIRHYSSVLDIREDRTAPLRIFHQSFRDYLVSHERCGGEDWHVDIEKQHLRLMEECLRLLSNLKKDVCAVGSPGTLLNDIDPAIIALHIPPEIQYACRYWVDHTIRSRQSLLDHGSIHRFLQQHYLHWLETMAWMGRLSEFSLALASLEDYVDSQQSPLLHSFTNDAGILLRASIQTITQAPLQTYCSVLLYLHKDDPIRKQLQDQMPCWIRDVMISPSSAGSCLQILDHHSEMVNVVCFAPDNRMIASGSLDGKICLCDILTGSLRRSFVGHDARISCLAFSRDSKMLVSGSLDNIIRVWDVTSETVRAVFTENVPRIIISRVVAVAFSDDGESVLSISTYQNVLRKWEIATETHLDLVNLGGSLCQIVAAFSRDRKLFASRFGNSLIQIWDLEARETISECHLDSVEALAFTPDDETVVVGTWYGKIMLWNFRNNTKHTLLGGQTKRNVTNSIAISPDGRLIALSTSSGAFVLLDTVTGEVEATIHGHSGEVFSVAFSPDGRRITSGSEDETVRVWDIATACADKTVPVGHKGDVSSIDLSPDGQAIVTGSEDTTVRLWDTETGTVRILPSGNNGRIKSVRISPNGRIIAVGSDDGTVGLFSLSTGARLSTHEIRPGPVISLAFSSDSQVIAAGAYGGNVRIWNVLAKTEQILLQNYREDAYAVAFTASGDFLAIAFGLFGEQAELWEVSTGKRHHFTAEDILKLSYPLTKPSLPWVGKIHRGALTARFTRDEAFNSSLDPIGSLVISEKWIMEDEERILWLPPDHRASCAAVRDRTVAIGHASGRVSAIVIESGKKTV